MRVVRAILCLLLAACVWSTRAEKAQWIKGIRATASWDMVGNISPNEAERCALFEAQKAALRRAGVSTDVRSATFSVLAQGDEHHNDELFNQINSFYISGRVRLVGEPIYRKSIVNDIVRVTVEIEADVLQDQPSNPEFQLAIEGFRSLYREGEAVNFSVRPSQDCYVRVFWFDDTLRGKGSLLYPAEGYDADDLLRAGQVYEFPRAKTIDYATTLSPDVEREESFVFVVATRRKIPYMHSEVTFRDFFAWYFGLDSADRTGYYPFGFTVVK